MLYCPLGRHRWDWDGRPIRFPNLREETGPDEVYIPWPSRFGRATCLFCLRQCGRRRAFGMTFPVRWDGQRRPHGTGWVVRKPLVDDSDIPAGLLKCLEENLYGVFGV